MEGGKQDEIPQRQCHFSRCSAPKPLCLLSTSKSNQLDLGTMSRICSLSPLSQASSGWSECPCIICFHSSHCVTTGSPVKCHQTLMLLHAWPYTSLTFAISSVCAPASAFLLLVRHVLSQGLCPLPRSLFLGCAKAPFTSISHPYQPLPGPPTVNFYHPLAFLSPFPAFSPSIC